MKYRYTFSGVVRGRRVRRQFTRSAGRSEMETFTRLMDEVGERGLPRELDRLRIERVRPSLYVGKRIKK